MAVLSPEVKAIIAEVHPGIIATADRSGRPNVSPKGSFRVLDDEHVLFADVLSPRTTTNLLENPQVSALVLDPTTRRGCRIWGRAEVLASGALFDQLSQEFAARKRVLKHAVVIAVEESVLL